MTFREMFGKTVTYFSYEDEMHNVQNKTLNFYTALGGPRGPGAAPCCQSQYLFEAAVRNLLSILRKVCSSQ